MEVGDFTGDELDDVLIVSNVYSNYQGRWEGEIITVMKGDGFGSFTELPFTNVNSDFGQYFGMADFNNDGHQDLVFVHPGGSSRLYPPPPEVSATVMLGNGSGGFAPADPLNYIALGHVDKTMPTSGAFVERESGRIPRRRFWKQQCRCGPHDDQ